MAELFSSEEETRVDDILAVDLDYWIGLTDFASEGMKDMELKKKNIILGDWIWQESYEGATYVNWSPSQPDNFGGNEDCVEIFGFSKLWNDLTCDMKMSESRPVHALCAVHK